MQATAPFPRVFFASLRWSQRPSRETDRCLPSTTGIRSAVHLVFPARSAWSRAHSPVSGGPLHAQIVPDRPPAKDALVSKGTGAWCCSSVRHPEGYLSTNGRCRKKVFPEKLVGPVRRFESHPASAVICL